MFRTVRILTKRTLLFCLPLLLLGLFLSHSKELDSASFTSASATLSNPRLSFYGGVAAGVSYNGTSVTIIGAGATYPDLNTNHLFPGDTLTVGVDGNAAVGGVIDATHFFTTDGLRAAASINDKVLATQSGTLSVGFTTTTDIPPGGDIIVTLPDPPANGSDGAPNNEASLATNGFDLNGMLTANVSCPATGGFSAESVNAGNGTTGHTIICSTTVGMTAPAALTVVIGTGAKPLINPAAINVGHTQGIADIYTVNVKTRDAANATLDDSDILVAPIESVLVSATIDEVLSFSIQGIATGQTACGNTTDVTTTATTVPWGTITLFESFYDGAHRLAVQTNADGGYAIKVEENDQMGKNGDACTGTAPSSGEFNFSGSSCIRDSVCGAAACSESAARDWTTSTYVGLGYSLQDIGVGNTDAVFDFDGKAGEATCTTGTFCARQFADIAGSETRATIMTNSDPMATHYSNVCYRLSINPLQPAGYYYNKVKYTCTATF